ncbi:MAG: sensor histidine kinase [Clostridiales bacterium]|nr:sensor histidine kinase [Clostridiales bacterium]
MKNKFSLTDYIKTKYLTVAFFALIFVFLGVSFALYELPLAAVLYPFTVSLIIFAVWLALDYRRELKRHMEISCLEKRNEELATEISELKHKSDERTDYYSVWAHQIKTPISSMRLSLGSADSETNRHLSYDLHRIESYVDMAMTYLRLDSDSTDFAFGEYDIDEIIKGAVRRLSGEFVYRRIRLEYLPLGYRALTDEKWLSFIIEQILSNALKYTKEGGSVAIYKEDDMTLFIRDTGIGISPEDLPRIFERGFTGYNGREDKKASGIGLYLCRRICGALGHKITVTSEVGVGTTVMLDLRRERVMGE